ncbi:hypothetical protein J4558_25085 [Leptolyngbya sp. 15MV]|nr:hypothetical protein J4558_25085 [Leptolyngbya sp. 15MV]
MQVPTHTQIDTTELIRIVGHATDAVAGTRARLAAIIARICPLIGALCGAAAIARYDSGGAPPEFDCFASAGQWDDEARSASGHPEFLVYLEYSIHQTHKIF